MGERFPTERIFPLAHGLHDRVGPRGVPAGAARSMDRIEHTRGNVASGKGTRKLTRECARTACLEIGEYVYQNGEAGYGFIPAQDAYAALLSAPTNYTFEFTIEVRVAPTSTSAYQTVICWGTPYTTDKLNFELFLNKSTTSNAFHLWLGWEDSGAFSGSNTRTAKSWLADMFINTIYRCRMTVTHNAAATPDVFELYVDNVSKGTIDNNVGGTKRPIRAQNCPLYLGGVGNYPNVSSGRETGKFRIQELRIHSTVLDAADATVARFTQEALRIPESNYSANLVAYWPLDDGAGHVFRDLSGRGNDGFLGPGALVVTEGRKAAPGAIYLDGHSSFLQADLRWHDAYNREWRPNSFINTGTAVRYGLSVRLAVLDMSRVGSGVVRLAELMGSDRRDRPAAALEIDTNGFPRWAWYDGGSIRYLTGTVAVQPGKMVLYEFFLDGATNNQEFYIDGEQIATDVRVGCDADLPKFIRIGSSADFATDNQTFWSRFSPTILGAPVLVEEVRLWFNRLSSTEVNDRWERLLTDEQVVENLGVAGANVTHDSVTVTAQGTPLTAYINAYLVTNDTIEGLNETTRKQTTDNKIYFVTNIAGSTITLVTPYRGRTIKGKGVGVTRLGGYWKMPAPDEGLLATGANDLIDFAEVSPQSDPDYEGTLMETTSQIASLPLIADAGAVGQGMSFCWKPYQNQISPLYALPQWRMGILRKQDSPVRMIAAFEQKVGNSIPVAQHHSNLLHIDDRWRTVESPYVDDQTPGSLAFLGVKDSLTVPAASALNVQTGGYTHWSWQGWLFFEEADSPMAIVCRASDTDPGEINHLLYYDRGRFRFRFCTGGNGRDYYTTEKALLLGWHYIEATNASGTFYLFVDGLLKTTAFDVVGGGGTNPASPGTVQRLGWVHEALRNDYAAFNGKMADVQLLVKNGLPAGAHTTSYEPSRVRITAGADHFYLYALNDNIDALAANSVTAGSAATVRSHPFVPLIEGLGICPQDQTPSVLTINRRLYGSTGTGPPKVFDDGAARRAGIIPPLTAPYVKYGYVNKWNDDNPDYGGANDADGNNVNYSLQFEGYNFIRCAYKSGSTIGMNLSGRGDSANNRDVGVWDLWFKPERLDIPMVLFGKNFGRASGNYAVVLEPNSTKTALRPKFIFYCKKDKTFKWFATNDYPITSTANWTYLWTFTGFGETGGARLDQFKIQTEAGATGSAIVNYGNGAPNALADSGDLGVNDQPDDTSADILIGWSDILIEDQYYHGFYGKIAEWRMATDADNDATHVTRTYAQGPTTTPLHILKLDPTDAAYEAAGAAWAGTNIGELNPASIVLNLNEGKGTDVQDTSGNTVTCTLEDYHDHGVGVSGTIGVRVTFYDPETGLESNPGPAFEMDLQAALGPEIPARAWLEINNLPIAGEPGRTLYRRVYRTAEDANTYYLCAEVKDNRAGGVIAEVRADLLVQETVLEFDHSPPPRYRVASTDQDRLYLAKVHETGAYYSKTYFPEYVPAEQFLPLTSDKESACRAIGQLYGYTVFFLEESVVVGVFVSSEQGLKLSMVGTDGGAISGGSLIQAARMLWRPSKNGVYAFTGTSDAYRGRPIGRPDGFWNNIDLRWGGITGAYWRPREQAIWVMRRVGEERPSIRLALDLSGEQVGDQAAAAYVFTVAETPEIAAIGVAETDSLVPRLLGGDYSGAVWLLDDGDHDGPRTGARVAVVNGSPTTTVIPTNATTFDTTRDGLRGMVATVVNVDGQRGSGRILSNTASELTLMDALGFTPAAGAAVNVGDRTRSWKTGFLSYSEAQEAIKAWGHLDISTDAVVGAGIRVRAWVDFDEATPYDLGVHPTDTGHVLIRLVDVPRSRYLQLEFSGNGPFAIHDYSVSIRDGQQDNQ